MYTVDMTLECSTNCTLEKSDITYILLTTLCRNDGLRHEISSDILFVL